MNDFLRSAEAQLKFNKDKSSVMAELGDHVETKVEFFESIGYDEEASAEKANEAMGSGEIIGQRLNQIHNRMRKASAYLIVASAIANIGLNAAILLADKSNYSIPYAAALFILVCNLAFTYAAIKFKSLWLSAASMIFSLAAVWLSSPYLSYPLCNLIINHLNSDPSKIYSFSSIMLSICLSALVFLPNGFNIYHCAQMKRLKNTKKQNCVAAALRNACLILGILIFILSFPYYAMNDSLCEEQAQIREELMDFAFEAVNEYDFKDKDELEEFLENSKYDFEYTPEYEEYGEFKNTPITHGYVYRIGNWEIKFEFYNSDYWLKYSAPRDKYGVSVSNITFNISQRYLITSAEQQEKLSDTIINPKHNSTMYSIYSSTLPGEEPIQLPQEFFTADVIWMGPRTAVGMSADEIREAMHGVSLMAIGLYKNGSSTMYYYDYQGLDTSNRLFIYCYSFYCDDENICTNYDLIYDYHTITASWQNK
ncbi:MAG: hypothetical protein J1E05_00870 [Eubacterium sp.]|nr:hypothetical protein [Eubacterium sp.]